MKFAKWVYAVARHWYGYAGGTFVAVLLLIVQQVMGRRFTFWYYVLILALGLFWSMFAAWSDEHDSKNKSEKWMYDGRPLFVLNVVKQPTWTAGKGETIFTLHNCGGRPARWIRLGMQKSRLDYYTMTFAEISALGPGDTTPITYAIDQHGQDQRMLCEFLGDNPPGAALVWGDIPISFRDTDESTGSDVVRLCFDIQGQ